MSKSDIKPPTDNSSIDVTPIRVRPIRVLQRIRKDPILDQLMADQEPIIKLDKISTVKQFEYYAQLKGCEIQQSRPTLFRWDKEHLSLTGVLSLKLSEIPEDLKDFKISFVSDHVLISKEFKCAISEEYFNRPFLIHVEVNGSPILQFPCLIEHNKDDMEYVLQILDNLGNKYTHRELFTDIFKHDEYVYIYFSGTVKLVQTFSQ